MASVLLSWIGTTDLRAAKGDPKAGTGPVAQAIESRGFDHAVLLDDHPTAESDGYLAWLQKRTAARIELRRVRLSSPTHYGEIYREATAAAAWAIAGVQFGDSIERGEAGHQDRVSILEERSRLDLWAQYLGAPPAFDEAGPAREFTGRRGR